MNNLIITLIFLSLSQIGFAQNLNKGFWINGVKRIDCDVLPGHGPYQIKASRHSINFKNCHFPVHIKNKGHRYQSYKKIRRNGKIVGERWITIPAISISAYSRANIFPRCQKGIIRKNLWSCNYLKLTKSNGEILEYFK
jgi:hypothetical protein